MISTLRCAAHPPSHLPTNKTKQQTAASLPVFTPLALQLRLQEDPLQLPLQGGGDAAVLGAPRQTLPAAGGCDQLLQLDPGAWRGNGVCDGARAFRRKRVY